MAVAGAGANIRATVGLLAMARATCMAGHCFQLRANGLKGRVTSRSITPISARNIISSNLTHPCPSMPRSNLRCCALSFPEKVVTVPLAAKLGPESDLDQSIFYSLDRSMLGRIRAYSVCYVCSNARSHQKADQARAC